MCTVYFLQEAHTLYIFGRQNKSVQRVNCLFDVIKSSSETKLSAKLSLWRVDVHAMICVRPSERFPELYPFLKLFWCPHILIYRHKAGLECILITIRDSSSFVCLTFTYLSVLFKPPVCNVYILCVNLPLLHTIQHAICFVMLNRIYSCFSRRRSRVRLMPEEEGTGMALPPFVQIETLHPGNTFVSLHIKSFLTKSLDEMCWYFISHFDGYISMVPICFR